MRVISTKVVKAVILCIAIVIAKTFDASFTNANYN